MSTTDVNNEKLSKQAGKLTGWEIMGLAKQEKSFVQGVLEKKAAQDAKLSELPENWAEVVTAEPSEELQRS